MGTLILLREQGVGWGGGKLWSLKGQFSFLLSAGPQPLSGGLCSHSSPLVSRGTGSCRQPVFKGHQCDVFNKLSFIWIEQNSPQ